MEEKKLTQEELLEADAFFNLASMLGRSIRAAAYQIQHPDYKPEEISVSVDLGEDDEAEAETPEESQAPEATPANSMIHSEGSMATQLAQVAAAHLVYFSHECFRSSALFHLFLFAYHHLKQDNTPKEDFAFPLTYSSEDENIVAVAWVLAKRVFTICHPDETLNMLNICDNIIDVINGKLKTPTFRQAGKADLEMIEEGCNLFVVDASEEPVQQVVEAMAENVSLLPKSDKLFLPRSILFRRMLDIAKTGEVENYPVDRRGTTIQVQIRGKDKEKVLGLSPLARSLQSTIGQMLQQFRAIPGNETKPIIVSTDKIYREFAGKDDSYSPSESQRKEIEEAMAVLMETYISLDYSIQVEKHHLDQKDGFAPDNVRHRTPLIMADHISAFHKGSMIKDAYRIWQAPAVYEHAFITGQIDTVDKRLLTGYTKERQKAGVDDITLRRYLLVEINRIKYNKRHQKITGNHTETINFASISSGSGFNTGSPKLWRTLRSKTETFLQEQVEANNIKKFSPVFVKQKQTGVSITV